MLRPVCATLFGFLVFKCVYLGFIFYYNTFENLKRDNNHKTNQNLGELLNTKILKVESSGVRRILAPSIRTQPCAHRHTGLCLSLRPTVSAHKGACRSSLPDSSAWFRTLRHGKKVAPRAPPPCTCPAKAPIATLWGTSSARFQLHKKETCLTILSFFKKANLHLPIPLFEHKL